VRITTLTRLELAYLARIAGDWQAELDVPPLAAMPIQYLTPAIEDRASSSSFFSPTAASTERRVFRTSWSPPPLSSPA
jgi:hypothetical protein